MAAPEKRSARFRVLIGSRAFFPMMDLILTGPVDVAQVSVGKAPADTVKTDSGVNCNRINPIQKEAVSFLSDMIIG